MVNYHSNEVICKLVNYIEKYHPEVLFMVRPKDTTENRRKGYKSGQPDIMILEQKCGYMGLAIWATSEMSKTKTRFLKRLLRVSYETVVSDDYDDLRLQFLMYMAKCDGSNRTDSRQLEVIEDLNHSGTIGCPPPSRSPLTALYYDTLKSVVSYVRDEYPSAVVIPGLDASDKPDLTIISPDVIHNGLAIWISETSRCYNFFTLTDKQLGYLKRMADRSYVTIASEDYQDITDIIYVYMRGDYEHCNRLPEFMDENCP